MENLYFKLLAWSIMKLVNRQKTYTDRIRKLNNIINGLIDVYTDYRGGLHECKEDN